MSIGDSGGGGVLSKTGGATTDIEVSVDVGDDSEGTSSWGDDIDVGGLLNDDAGGDGLPEGEEEAAVNLTLGDGGVTSASLQWVAWARKVADT